MDDPFTLKNAGYKLYGRGTYDMLAGRAIQMGLANYFSQHPCPITLVFTFVADEENLSIGMEHLVDYFIPVLPGKPFLGIFFEPTEEHIGISHKGFAWFEIEIKGLASHGSRPEQGVNANFPLSYALKELETINAGISCRETPPFFGSCDRPPETHFRWFSTKCNHCQV